MKALLLAALFSFGIAGFAAAQTSDGTAQQRTSTTMHQTTKDHKEGKHGKKHHKKHKKHHGASHKSKEKKH